MTVARTAGGGTMADYEKMWCELVEWLESHRSDYRDGHHDCGVDISFAIEGIQEHMTFMEHPERFKVVGGYGPIRIMTDDGTPFA